MKEKLRNLCLKGLFYILDVRGSEIEEDDKEIARWLSMSAGDIGFIRYVQMRERAIVKALLMSGMASLPRDTFLQQTGQRFENQNLLRRANIARQKNEHKLEERKRKAEELSDN